MKIIVITRAIGDTVHAWAQVIVKRFSVQKTKEIKDNKDENKSENSNNRD